MDDFAITIEQTVDHTIIAASENFTQQTITTNADGAYSVFAADVDGDGRDEIVYQAMVIDDDGTRTVEVWHAKPVPADETCENQYCRRDSRRRRSSD